MSQLHLTDAEVAQYLAEHPDFFVGKDDLLANLRVPHDAGPATSLIERQMLVHRQRNVELRQRLTDLLENARRNDQLFLKTRRLTLALLEADSWLALQAALDDSLRKDFSVDTWALLHFTERKLEQPLISISNADEQRRLHRLFKGHRAICGQLAMNDMASLLGVDVSEARSVAAAQIHGQVNSGILTLASKNPNMYRSSMDTLFLDFVADILALRLAQLPVVK